MRKLATFLPVILLFISCGDNKQDATAKKDDSVTQATDSVTIVNDPKNNSTVQLNAFSEIDTSGILFFPLSLKTGPGGSIMEYSSRGPADFWNIVFLNTKTNESYLLDTGKMRIRSYQVGSGNEASITTQTRSHIYYSVVTDDLNADKQLKEDDPQYLFVSDKSGKHFRRISPRMYHLINWAFIKSSGKVIMIVKKDTNKDQKFNEEDESATFEINPDTETEPREVFSIELKNKLKLLHNRQWKKAEK